MPKKKKTFNQRLKQCQRFVLQAGDHICTKDIVITHSIVLSTTLKKFFDAARKAKRKFRVFAIGDENVDVEPLSAVDVLTVMQQATRVVIAAAAVFTDGSCLAPAGWFLCLLAFLKKAV